MPKRLRVLTGFTLGLCVAYFGIVLATANQPSDNSDAGPTKQFEPKIAAASNEARQAMGQVRVPHGLTIELFAAEPLLANPVAFCFDEKGRCFVAETFRLHKGVTDNRGHPSKWTDDDLAARTVADRLALYKKHLGAKYDTYGGHDDRIRLLEDTDG